MGAGILKRSQVIFSRRSFAQTVSLLHTYEWPFLGVSHLLRFSNICSFLAELPPGFANLVLVSDFGGLIVLIS